MRWRGYRAMSIKSSPRQRRSNLSNTYLTGHHDEEPSAMTTPLQSNSRDVTDLVNKPLAYSFCLRVLHWTTALLMFVTIPVAWYMTGAELSYPIRKNWFSFHESIGLTLLFLTLTRVVTRMSSSIPPLPERIPKFERFAAHVSHGLLYVILFAMPISGYINVSGL
jgi:hypothetical protein